MDSTLNPDDAHLARLDDIHGPPPDDPESRPFGPRPCPICGGPPPTSPDDDSHDDCYDWQAEGPTCSICDAVGHGYPGGGPCPLESPDPCYYADELAAGR
ncbi:MAG: hypothetical protein M3011_00275 [Actinomycetota bacterium]|nr:hypothetical protein [Actinomycetota bacterium]